MDIAIIAFGVVLITVGLIGCIVPFLPGPPLAFVALLLLELTGLSRFGTDFLILWGSITAAVTVIDYWLPVYGTKKLGGSRHGVRGATIGLIAGIFIFPPIGLIIGPFLGAYIGEITAGRKSATALRSAFGSFVGLIAGTLMKLAITLVMAYHFVRALIMDRQPGTELEMVLIQLTA